MDATIQQVRRLSPDLSIIMLAVTDPQNWNGPLFNDYGDVIGVNSAYVQQQGLVIVVPVNYLKSMMNHPVALSPDEFAKRTRK